MDSFQWTTGYEKKYGLYHVDMGDDNRERIQKASARFYSNVIKHGGLNWNYPAHFVPEGNAAICGKFNLVLSFKFTCMKEK